MATSVDMTKRAFAVAFDNLEILRALLQKAEWRMPVSYTHLDVYKRQSMPRSSGM